MAIIYYQEWDGNWFHCRVPSPISMNAGYVLAKGSSSSFWIVPGTMED